MVNGSFEAMHISCPLIAVLVIVPARKVVVIVSVSVRMVLRFV
jgi:hypothetical protein